MTVGLASAASSLPRGHWKKTATSKPKSKETMKIPLLNLGEF
jgi:hypothetical protein